MAWATCRTCGHAESRPAPYCAVCGAPLSRVTSPRAMGPGVSRERAGKRRWTSRARFVLLTVFVLALLAWLAHSAARQLDQLAYRPISERHLQRRLYDRSLDPQPDRTQLPPGSTP